MYFIVVLAQIFKRPILAKDLDDKSETTAPLSPCDSDRTTDTDLSFGDCDSFDEASVASVASVASSCSELSCSDESLFDEISLAALCDLIGPEVGKDALDTKFDGTGLPSGLKNEVVIELPVGYFRIRKAFLSSKSSFWKKAILRNTLSYRKVTTTPWDHHEKNIGQPSHSNDIDTTAFIGAKRQTDYLMPAGKLVSESMAHEEATLKHYNDDFFTTEMTTSTPSVPFGKKFLAKTQIVVVNTGNNTCRMICSVETAFPKGAPFGVAGQIKKGMKTGTLEMFEKIASHIRTCVEEIAG